MTSVVLSCLVLSGGFNVCICYSTLSRLHPVIVLFYLYTNKERIWVLKLLKG